MFSPLDENRLYTSSQFLYMSTDDGQSWRKLSPDLTYADPETLGETGGLITMDMNGPEIYATIFAVVPSAHDLDTIWVGSDDGRVHITRDHGDSWTEITPPGSAPIQPGEHHRRIPASARRRVSSPANRYQVDDPRAVRLPHDGLRRDLGEDRERRRPRPLRSRGARGSGPRGTPVPRNRTRGLRLFRRWRSLDLAPAQPAGHADPGPGGQGERRGARHPRSRVLDSRRHRAASAGGRRDHEPDAEPCSTPRRWSAGSRTA